METPSPNPRSGSETRQRSGTIIFRASPAERAEIEAAAERAGLSLGSYIRARLLTAPETRSRRRPTVEQAVMAQLLAQLGRAGGNVYQLSRRMNFGENAIAEVPDVIAEIRAAGAAVMQALGRSPR